MTVPTPVQDVLDDGVLSRGTLLLHTPRTTEAAPSPDTRGPLVPAAASGSQELFAERRREDAEVVARP